MYSFNFIFIFHFFLYALFCLNTPTFYKFTIFCIIISHSYLDIFIPAFHSLLFCQLWDFDTSTITSFAVRNPWLSDTAPCVVCDRLCYKLPILNTINIGVVALWGSEALVVTFFQKHENTFTKNAAYICSKTYIRSRLLSCLQLMIIHRDENSAVYFISKKIQVQSTTVLLKM